MKRADIFQAAKISVPAQPPIAGDHAAQPQTKPLDSNNHHNSNSNNSLSHLTKPRSFSHCNNNGTRTHKRVKKIRLVIPRKRKRKLQEIKSNPNSINSSDYKQNESIQEPPPKKQKLIPPLHPPQNHNKHKPQPPSLSMKPVLLPPPPPLQSMSPPPKLTVAPNNASNPYLFLQSQLATHYKWPSHNNEGAPYTHICDECGQGFMSGNALGGHKGQHTKARDRGIHRQITGAHKYKSNQYYYPNNNQQRNNNVQSTEKKKRKRNNRHNQPDVNGNYPRCDEDGVAYTHVCEICDKGFSSGSALGGHRAAHRRMAKRGKKYNRSTGKHEYMNKEQEMSHEDTDSSVGEYYNNGNVSHVATARHQNHVVINPNEYKQYKGLQNKEIMNKIIDKLCAMDENKLFHCSKIESKCEDDDTKMNENETKDKEDNDTKMIEKQEDDDADDDSKMKEIENNDAKMTDKQEKKDNDDDDDSKMSETSHENKDNTEKKDIAKKQEERDPNLNFEVIRNKIQESKYESIQADFMADVNKLFRCIFKKYTNNDIEYKSALKLKQFAYRQCMAALGTVSNNKRDKYELEYHLECIPMTSYEEIADYEFFCDESILKEKMKCRKPEVECDGNCCNKLDNLGPYCLASEAWKSSCLCRSKQMECSDKCGCDPLLCKNRAIHARNIKKDGVSIREQEVFGIDQHTRMCIEKLLPTQIKDVYSQETGADEDVIAAKTYFIEKLLLPAINNYLFFIAEHPQFTSKYDPKLQNKPNESEASFMITDVLRSMLFLSKSDGERRIIEYMLLFIMDMAYDQLSSELCGIERSKRRMNYAEISAKGLKGINWFLNSCTYEGECMVNHFEFPIYSKGRGVTCIDAAGIRRNEYIISFLGVVYAPWCWYEKDDRTRWLVKSRGAPKQPEFFNIMMEKHRDDAHGYDLVFIDPSHKGNYGSRLSHSCSPNCISVSMGVDNKYNIAVYASDDIKYGEELCFNYNSVTESEAEWQDAVCLCGSKHCAGQFLIYAGTMLYTEVLKKAHHLLHRTAALFVANERNQVTKEEKEILAKYSLTNDGALRGIPQWMKSYAAAICKYIDYEQSELPKELLLKAQQGEKGYHEFIKSAAAQEESRGLKYVRLSNLVITLNKMNLFFRQPVNKGLINLPLFKQYRSYDVIQRIWFASNSIISDLYVALAINCGENHAILARINEMRRDLLNKNSSNNLKLSSSYLMELRDKLLLLPPTAAAYHHAASDILLFYAQTRYFFYFYPPFQGFQSRAFTYHELGYYNTSGVALTQPPPKKYAQQYVWGQLNFWERHSIESPDSSLSAERRGTITLPNIKCCYANFNRKQKVKLVKQYSLNVRKQFVAHLQFKNQNPWSSKWPFAFKNGALYGSPWLDAHIDAENQQKKFENMIKIIKETKMIYVDATFTSLKQEEEMDFIVEKEEEEFKQEEEMKKKKKKKKVHIEKENNKENKEKKEIVGKAKRRSQRLRGKQIPSYVEPKQNEF